ncbi:ferredoxin [uncultured Zhongshania sp.]|nr:ferredoxin [uncultured Zhongshania sp.]
MGEAPDHFKIDGSGILNIIKSDVSDEEKQQVAKAVQFCPNQALRLETE